MNMRGSEHKVHSQRFDSDKDRNTRSVDMSQIQTDPQIDSVLLMLLSLINTSLTVGYLQYHVPAAWVQMFEGFGESGSAVVVTPASVTTVDCGAAVIIRQGGGLSSATENSLKLLFFI